jgi:AcrR family transcriptional regulator
MKRNKQSRKRLNSADRRAQIIDVSLSLFASKGFNGTKTREIAEKAGVSEALLYRHFATKEELYRTVLGELLDVHSASIDCKKAMDERDDYSVFSTFAWHVIDFYRKDPRTIRLVFFSALEGSPIEGAFRPVKNKNTIELLADYIQQRIDEGAFRPVSAILAGQLLMETMVMFMVDQEASLTAETMSFADKEVVDTTVRIFVDGLKAGSLDDNKVSGEAQSINK